MEKQRNKLFGALIVVAIMAIGFLSTNAKLNNVIRVRDEHNAKVAEALNEEKFSAEAISVYDITDHKLIFGKNENEPFSMASLAKILTVLIGLSMESPDRVVQVSKESIRQAGDFGIFANEKWKLSDIAKFTLIMSANDGAYAISETNPQILNRMNIFAQKMGLKRTYFNNVTGLDVYEDCRVCMDQPGAVTTAQEMNLISAFALESNPEIFGVTALPTITLQSESGFLHTFTNTDILIGKIPNLLFSKTGYTKLSGGNLSIILKDKDSHLIAVTVLSSTYNGRFEDMEKIVNVLYND